MKKNLLNKIIEKKKKKIEFSIITNLKNGEGFIFEKGEKIDKNFKNMNKKLNFFLIKKRMV